VKKWRIGKIENWRVEKGKFEDGNISWFIG
jgi:hypothetical protein